MATSSAPPVSPDVARLVAASEAGLAKQEQLSARLSRDAQATISRLGALQELETRTRTEIHRVNGMIATLGTRRRQLEGLVETRDATLGTAIANGADPATLRSRSSSFRRILTGSLPPELLTPLRMPQVTVAQLRAHMPAVLQRLTAQQPQHGASGSLSAATKALTVTGPAGMPASPVSRSSAFADSGSGGSPTSLGSRGGHRTLSRTMSGRALEAAKPVDPDKARAEATEVEASLAAVQRDADALSIFSQQLQAADAQMHHALGEAQARESDIAPTFEALTEAIEAAQTELQAAEVAASGRSSGDATSSGSAVSSGGGGGGQPGGAIGAMSQGDATSGGSGAGGSSAAAAGGGAEGTAWDAALHKARSERAMLVAGGAAAAAGGGIAAGAMMAGNGTGAGIGTHEGKTSAAEAGLPGPEVEQAGATLPPMQLEQSLGTTTAATAGVGAGGAGNGIAATAAPMEISTPELGPQKHAYTITQSQPRSPTPVGSVMPDHESQLAGVTTAAMDFESLEAAAEARGADEAAAAVIASSAARATAPPATVGTAAGGIPIKQSQAHSPTPVASVMPGGPDFRDSASPPLGLRDVMGSPSDMQPADAAGAPGSEGGADKAAGSGSEGGAGKAAGVAGSGISGGAAAGGIAAGAGIAGAGMAMTRGESGGIASPETVVAGESAREAANGARQPLQPGQMPVAAHEVALDTSNIPSSPPLEKAIEGGGEGAGIGGASSSVGAAGTAGAAGGMGGVASTGPEGVPITTAVPGASQVAGTSASGAAMGTSAAAVGTSGAAVGTSAVDAIGSGPGATIAAQQAAAAIASQTGFAGTAVTMAPMAAASAAPGAPILGTGAGGGLGTTAGTVQPQTAGAAVGGAGTAGQAQPTVPQATEGAVGGMSGVQPPPPIHIPGSTAGAGPMAGGQYPQAGQLGSARQHEGPVACLDRCCIVQ